MKKATMDLFDEFEQDIPKEPKPNRKRNEKGFGRRIKTTISVIIIGITGGELGALLFSSYKIADTVLGVEDIYYMYDQNNPQHIASQLEPIETDPELLAEFKARASRPIPNNPIQVAEDLVLIDSLFGLEHYAYDRYDAAYAESNSHEFARESLLPAPLIPLPTRHKRYELASVFLGEYLSVEQAEALSTLTSKRIPPAYEKLNRVIIINFEKGKSYLHSIDGVRPLDKDPWTLQVLISSEHTIYYIGKPDEKILEEVRKANPASIQALKEML